MASIPISQPKRGWLPWARYDDLQDHLRDDAEVHRQARAQYDEIITGLDAANIGITALSDKIKPLLPIAGDLDQMVGQRKFRHELYKLVAKTGHSLKKIIGWGGGTLVGLATLAAVYPPANSLLMWLLAKITFGAVAMSRLPAIASTPPIPGVTH